jgi:hypothetical protein
MRLNHKEANGEMQRPGNCSLGERMVVTWTRVSTVSGDGERDQEIRSASRGHEK